MNYESFLENLQGVLMEREGLTADAACELLRCQARSRSRKLAEVARQVIAQRRSS